jgi:uncharacterized SAM-binding protein YcdF (DUF218 family)
MLTEPNDLAVIRKPPRLIYARKGLVTGVGFLILLSSLLWFSREVLLSYAADLWIVSDDILPADAIVILGGGIDTRPFAAAETYRKGLAPKVLISNVALNKVEMLGILPSHTTVNRSVLVKLGVREADIEIFGNQLSTTYEEGEALREWATRIHARSVIVPTEMFSSRRVRWTLAHVLAGTGTSVQIQMIPPANSAYNQTSWWKTHTGLIAFQNEIMKYFYYRWMY